ncbi:unnamed protein product [Peronospora farinosa]|uniref:CCT domain-containing protein n=1 Tax=Peronospora farinosa TaxID=134698 RepID=A0AAV0T6Z8_9STRA|nr:unnamed protein product [Peronospora farinosa]
MHTRVFVRLYDGVMQYETDDEVLQLPPPPLKWKDAITAMVAAVGKQSEYEDGVTMPKARLFLLPTEAAGIAAELNARSLRFGVRENDRFVVCLRGEDYQQPSERQASAEVAATATSGVSSARPMTLSTPSSSCGTTEPSIFSYANGQNAGESNNAAPSGNMGGPLSGGLGGNAPSGNLMSSGKKGSKRYRSVSGKMAAIKSLGDMGLISNDDRGHLKDLVLNSDSPELQEALDKYNNTGDFQAVKDLLLKEMQNPLSKRNTTDWLSESFVNDIALNFNTMVPAVKTDSILAQNINQGDRFSPVPIAATPPANTYRYQTTSQSTPMNSTVYSQSSPVAVNHYSASGSLVVPTGGNLSTSNGYSAEMPVSNGYQPTTVMPQLYHQPHASPTNNMYRTAPQINLPLRDRATYMKREYESSPAHNMLGIRPPAVFPAAPPQLGMDMCVMQQGYAINQGPPYPANIVYAGDQSQYSMSPYMAGGVYNQHHHQPQYAMNRYGYGSTQPEMGYNFYAAGYGYGKAQLCAGPGGKWTNAPPMPSYPPPCSKEEKKEKIAKWLKKRETRNWSNKPSYPVRHSIAKNRKRGEDGRFITKARLAEMAAEEAAAAATRENSDEPQHASLPSSTSEEAPILIVSQTTMPQATPVP